MISSGRAAQECVVRRRACRPGEECLGHAPSPRASNHVTETVSRRPRSPKRRKTKPVRGAKLPFNVEVTRESILLCPNRVWRPILGGFRRSLGPSRRCCLSVVRGALKPASRAPFPRLFSFSRPDSPCCWCAREDDGRGGLLGGSSAKPKRHSLQ